MLYDTQLNKSHFLFSAPMRELTKRKPARSPLNSCTWRGTSTVGEKVMRLSGRAQRCYSCRPPQQTRCTAFFSILTSCAIERTRRILPTSTLRSQGETSEKAFSSSLPVPSQATHCARPSTHAALLPFPNLLLPAIKSAHAQAALAS